MKHTRRFVTLIIVLAMVMMMAFSVSADGTDGKITVDNAINGQTYNIYRIFDLTYSGNAYSYSLNRKWGDFFVGNNAPGAKYIGSTETDYPVTVDNQTLYIQVTDATAAASLAADARAYIDSANVANDGSATASGTSVVFENLPYGYYLLDTTTGTLCSLNSAANEVTIKDKTTAPTISKTVREMSATPGQESITAEIGTLIAYDIVITAGDGAQNYVFVDEIPDFITTIEEDCSGSITGATLAISDNKITYDLSGQTLTKGQEITISIVGYLNEKAVSGTSGNVNTAYLYYGEDGDDADTLGDLSVSDSATVYCYSFDLVKTDENDKLLSGAVFCVCESESASGGIPLVKVSDEMYRIPAQGETGTVTEFTVTTGKVTISGLKGDNTTYYVGEITPPEGYNAVSTRQPIIITDKNETATINGDTYVEGGIQVINNTGSVLPSTGGIGTTIFYILGGILAVGALIVLVTNKRMRAN